MHVTPEDIGVISGMVHKLCGVVLDESKGYLIESRLSRIAEDLGCKSFGELNYKIRYHKDPELENQIVDAITTQETLFFRDNSPFDAMQYKVVPELIDVKANTTFPKRIRIWCAACSTGQEPYSIAVLLSELLPDIHSWDVNIFATDISDQAIQKASMGRYAQHEIQRGLKPELLQKYFHQDPNGWKIKDETRSLVAFRKMNLLKTFPNIGPFDIIFCRNVAIYFNPEDRRSLFLRLAEKLQPEGCLFVGSSESITDIDPKFIPQHHCRSVFYQWNKTPETSLT